MKNATSSWRAIICWLCFAVGTFWALVAIPVFGWIPFVLPLTAMPMGVILAVGRYGAKATLAYSLSAMIISSIFENLSVMVGFPFGHYHYTIGPQLFHVPWVIAPTYACFGFISWSVASILLGDADRRLHRTMNLVLLPLVAGAVMTMWDLVTDAKASTVRKAWIWEDGGRYFGVPETNFLGWWFVTYAFFQCFALYLRHSKTPTPEQRPGFHAYPPILLYCAMGMNVAVDFLLTPNRTVIDAAGGSWQLSSIVGPNAIVMLFTMLFVTILALHRLSDRT